MSTTTILHGQMSVVDELGNVTILHQETSAADVLVDSSTNTQIPSDVDTLQKLANKLGALAFKNEIKEFDLTPYIKNDLTTTEAGYVLDARAGKVLNDRLTSIENSEILTIGVDEENPDIIVPQSEINDNVMSDTLTWSSNKINEMIDTLGVDHNFYVELVESSEDVYVSQKTVQQIEEAYQAGRPIWVVASEIFIPLRKRVDASTWIFSGYADKQAYDISVTASGVTFTYTPIDGFAAVYNAETDVVTFM